MPSCALSARGALVGPVLLPADVLRLLPAGAAINSGSCASHAPGACSSTAPAIRGGAAGAPPVAAGGACVTSRLAPVVRVALGLLLALAHSPPLARAVIPPRVPGRRRFAPSASQRTPTSRARTARSPPLAGRRFAGCATTSPIRAGSSRPTRALRVARHGAVRDLANAVQAYLRIGRIRFERDGRTPRS